MKNFLGGARMCRHQGLSILGMGGLLGVLSATVRCRNSPHRGTAGCCVSGTLTRSGLLPRIPFWQHKVFSQFMIFWLESRGLLWSSERRGDWEPSTRWGCCPSMFHQSNENMQQRT